MSGLRKLSVLMPVYNEARTLRSIVKRVLSAPVGLEVELVCVDDHSTDASPQLLAELAAGDPRIRVFRHAQNLGKGAAIRTAITHMTGDVAIVQDADLEYDPSEFPKLLAPILDGRADAVYGSRYAASPERRVLFYWHTAGNRALTWLTNIIFDLNLTDMETCYKAVRADLLRSLRLSSNGFGFEPEVTARLAQWGARIYEVPVSYHGRSYAEGKNIGPGDAVQAVWQLAKYRFWDTAFTDDAVYQRQRVLSRAPRINQWRFRPLAPFLGRRVLEVGAGLGPVTQQLLDRDYLVAVDPNPLFVGLLDRRFGHLDNIEVRQVDVRTNPADLVRVGDGFDSVVSFNLLETVEDDRGLLEAMAERLRPGGRLLLLTSANPLLWAPADLSLGRLRRYRREALTNLIQSAGLVPEMLVGCNRLGAIGWLANKVLGNPEPSSGQISLFSLLLPVARALEAVKPLPHPNWVAAARKPL